MNDARYSANCRFCGKLNRRHTRLGRTYKCQYCHEVNAGPGLDKFFAKVAMDATKAAPTKPGKQVSEAPPTSAKTTTIRVAGKTVPTKTKAAPTAKRAAEQPAKPSQATPPKPKARGGLVSVIWG